MSNTTTTNQTFDQLLKKSLTAHDYDNLPTQLGLSKRKVTQIKENPQIGTMRQAIIFAMEVGLTTKELIDQYEFGYETITVGDYRKLA
jgi:hypothetical protein